MSASLLLLRIYIHTPYSYGAGYTAAVKDGSLYLGTNRGLYYTSYPVQSNGNLPDIRPVPQSSGQVWMIQLAQGFRQEACFGKLRKALGPHDFADVELQALPQAASGMVAQEIFFRK